MLYIWPLDLLHLQKGKVWEAYGFVWELKTSCLLGSLHCNAHRKERAAVLACQGEPQHCPSIHAEGPCCNVGTGDGFPPALLNVFKNCFLSFSLPISE